MELETNQFIKNKENDVFDHRTRGEWLIVQSVKISFVVCACYILYELLTGHADSSYWIDFFVIVVFGFPFVKMFFSAKQPKERNA